jgi:hypothetical protein
MGAYPTSRRPGRAFDFWTLPQGEEINGADTSAEYIRSFLAFPWVDRPIALSVTRSSQSFDFPV